MLDKQKVLEVYQNFYNYSLSIDRLYEGSEYKIRKPNFPEVISEFIVSCVLEDVTKGKTGDLVWQGKKIEVKCFSSKGPASFGPDES